MVSSLLSNVVADALAVGRDQAFFSQDKTKRSEAVVEKLSTDYPQPLRAYLSTADADAFLTDVQQLVPTLGSGGSVMRDVPELLASKNGLFMATVEALESSLLGWLHAKPAGSSRLASYCEHVRASGSLYKNILIREAQELLLSATKTDSPTLQVAADITDEERMQLLADTKLPGIPSVTTNRELLGGVRQFYNGTMNDDSWRARLTRALRIVS